jgi:hypothetical protein
MGANLLEKELATYERHKEELVLANEGRFVLIHGDAVAGVWDTYKDALAAGYAQFGLKPFLIKQIQGIERVLFFTRNLSVPDANIDASA